MLLNEHTLLSVGHIVISQRGRGRGYTWVNPRSRAAAPRGQVAQGRPSHPVDPDPWIHQTVRTATTGIGVGPLVLSATPRPHSRSTSFQNATRMVVPPVRISEVQLVVVPLAGCSTNVHVKGEGKAIVTEDESDEEEDVRDRGSSSFTPVFHMRISDEDLIVDDNKRSHDEMVGQQRCLEAGQPQPFLDNRPMEGAGLVDSSAPVSTEEDPPAKRQHMDSADQEDESMGIVMEASNKWPQSIE
ncbi:unnamed protein product [Linum trigynum]|uniref:Uncharacterized protein n=1 Tax=Linum trigynum TaxID=586398 RepID=A0AAV2F797_9ROSI